MLSHGLNISCVFSQANEKLSFEVFRKTALFLPTEITLLDLRPVLAKNW
jgi:hypothetical protein